MNLKFDPYHIERPTLHGITGIFVRAQYENGNWGNADLIELDIESVNTWLATLTPDATNRVVNHLLGTIRKNHR